MHADELKVFLDEKVDLYNRTAFIEQDPISIPHRFTRKEDIEIMGLLIALLSWGQRKTIIAKGHELISRLQDMPFEFIMHGSPGDWKSASSFVHRTFNGNDLFVLLAFLKDQYQQWGSLEMAFFGYLENSTGSKVELALNRFYNAFIAFPGHLPRTRKHLASPAKKSACKRLNMYLRWMVRSDDRKVDFGIWKQISPADLICPCDLHVDRVARLLGLISRKNTDWQTALELTDNLKKLDPTDPVKYDFALFGLGVERFL